MLLSILVSLEICLLGADIFTAFLYAGILVEAAGAGGTLAPGPACYRSVCYGVFRPGEKYIKSHFAQSYGLFFSLFHAQNTSLRLNTKVFQKVTIFF